MVERSGETIGAPEAPIYLGAAGTPVRFMLSFCASAKGQTLVTGNERLSERPMKDLLDAFDTAGIEYECKGEPGYLPVLVAGGPAKTADWKINGEVSSQFTSSLLILVFPLLIVSYTSVVIVSFTSFVFLGAPPFVALIVQSIVNNTYGMSQALLPLKQLRDNKKREYENEQKLLVKKVS